MRLPDHIRIAVIEQLRSLSPKAVYLFGSYGTARQHPASDLDLAVLPATPLDPVSRFQLANHLSTLLGIEVDLLDLSTSSTVMAKEVLRTGERLIADDLTAAREFEMRTLADYARLNEERRPILAR
jgi:predicted nucleotidyltransferase